MGGLIAAHIDGENAAEQRRIQPDQAEKRRGGFLQRAGEKRRKAQNADHGKRRRPEQGEALFEMLSQMETVSKEQIESAEQRAGG